jgi:serine/threonine protein kinase
MQDYQVGRELGRGAFGTVNLAVDKSSGVTRVVKTVPAHGDVIRSAARSEFERIRQFSHPNVVRAIEFYESPVSVQLVCEHCAGGDLYAAMRVMGRKFAQIDTRWIASAMHQVFLAVGYLHQQHHMVHNDLKPDNILLDRVPEGPMDVPRVMVADFGQSALFGVAQTGDPRYCSPEAHRLNLHMGDVPGPKGDVWMLGVTLYELLSGGRLPFLDQPCSLNNFRKSPALQHRLIYQGCLGHLEPTWSFLSGSGRRALHFVQIMLVKDERHRWSLPACLRHQWFEIAQERAAKPMDANAMQGLAARAHKSHVHKALRAMVATQLQGLELSNFKDVWQEIDKDNNGSIDKNEFVSYMVRQGMAPLEANDLFHAADLSSDGSIDFNEFVGICFDPLANEAQLHQHFLGVFRKIDCDSSGEISFEEMCALFGPTMSQQVILEIFQEMDTDRSGTISLDEFMSFAKTL